MSEPWGLSLRSRGGLQGSKESRECPEICSFHRQRRAGFCPVLELHVGPILIFFAAHVRLWLFSLLSALAAKSLGCLMVYSTAEFSQLRSGLLSVRLCVSSSSSYPKGIMKIESVLERMSGLYGENNQHKPGNILLLFSMNGNALLFTFVYSQKRESFETSPSVAQNTLSHKFHNVSSFYIVLHLCLVKYFDRFGNFSFPNKKMFK